MKLKPVKRSTVKAAQKKGLVLEIKCKKCGHVGKAVLCIAVDLLSRFFTSKFFDVESLEITDKKKKEKSGGNKSRS